LGNAAQRLISSVTYLEIARAQEYASGMFSNMTTDLRQKIQLMLALAIILAGARTAWIFYQRHQDAVQSSRKQPPPLNPDYYVTPKKLYPYDLTSAQELTRQPVWVKVGYAIDYVPYNAATRRADFSHPAGTFLPLEKLQIEKVASDSDQLIAVFAKNGKACAFSIGYLRDGQYRFTVNDLLFFEDPHQLYSHWPPATWQAIDQHQVKPGMTELQVAMSIGVGVPQGRGDYSGNGTLKYPDGGHPLTVTYQDGKAVEIKNAP
jgi:hypothetical protein